MPEIRLLMAVPRALLLVLMVMVWLPLPSSMSVNSGLTETSVGVSCCTSNLAPHILIVHLRGGKKSKARIIHNWKPKHKREGENPLQINKAHRKRRKEKQNEKAKRKLKNVLASCKMEDRENYHEIGLIDNPQYTRQFISKKQDILRGKLPENIDDNLEPHEMEELTMSGKPHKGVLDDGSKATDTKWKDEILMTNELDNDEELLWDDQGAQDLLETADVLKDPKQFCEGDIVKYRESDGTFRMAEIVSIDRSIIPHSYGIRLEGRIRETVEERIERISAPDKKSANETALVSMKIDPSERFYDFERGVFLHPLLREANMKRRMKRESGDWQNQTLIPMRNVRAKDVNMRVQGKPAGGMMNGQASSTLGNEDSDEALERVMDYTRQAKRKQILEAKAHEREYQRKCGISEAIRPRGIAKIRQDHRFRRYNR